MKFGGFQKLTLLDYPGQMACIVFTKGCNFRCPFCHNSGLVINGGEADEVDEEDVLAYLKQRAGMLDGIVVSGGEPLLHPDLPDFLRRVKALGYLVKLDTNGSFPARLKQVVEEHLVDYVAMDIKQAPKRYTSACGVPSERLVPMIWESLELLRQSGVPFELRTTVVQGIHTPEDLENLAAWIAGEQPLFLQSYKNSGNILKATGLSHFSQEELENMLKTVQKYCPNSYIRS